MIEQLATVSLSRDEAGLYSVVVRFDDGSEREVSSSEWRTVLSVFSYAAQLIAEKLHKRPEVIGDGSVP